MSPEGALFVAGSEDGTLRIGETDSGRITVSRDENAEQEKMWHRKEIAFSSSGRRRLTTALFCRL